MGLKSELAGKTLSESQAWCLRPVTPATWGGGGAEAVGWKVPG